MINILKELRCYKYVLDRKIRVCEYVFHQGKLLFILDICLYRNKEIWFNRHVSVEKMVSSGMTRINALIISGDVVHVFKDELLPGHDTSISMDACVHWSETDQGYAICKEERIRDILDILGGHGQYPEYISLAPFFFKNTIEKYCQLSTTTWTLRFNGHKLVDIENKEIHANSGIEKNYCLQVAKLLSSGIADALVHDFPVLVQNKMRRLERRKVVQIIVFFLGLCFIAQLTLASIENIKMIETGRNEKLREQLKLQIMKGKSLENQIITLDSVIRSKSNLEFRNALKIDKVCRQKSEDIRLLKIVYTSDLKPATTLELSGKCKTHVALSEWMNRLKVSENIQARILSLNRSDDEVRFKIAL